MSNRRKQLENHAPRVRPGISVPQALSYYMPATVAFLIVAAFLVYLPSIRGGFVFDDNQVLTENNLIKSPDGLYKFWCTTETLDYWPMTYTTLWLEWRLWGMHPAGYHATNLILHIAESLLVWIILRNLSIPGAFLAAMLFVLHPVNVESVAWISQRKNLMAMLFFLLSIWCYLKSDEKTPGTSAGAKQGNIQLQSINVWYWLSLAVFVLAMLSKGSAAVLPMLLVLIAWWQRPVIRWDLVRTAPFFAVAAVLAGVNMWFQTHGTGEVFRTAGFIERLLGAGSVVWFYLYKAFLPIDLVFIYPQWRIDSGNPFSWMPLLAAIVVTAALWSYRARWGRPFLFAWAFFCMALVPVMGFADVGFMRFSLVADRYQHIAIIGVIALMAAGLSEWRRRARGFVSMGATVFAVMIVGILALLTWLQSGFYHDTITLYWATLAKNPDCWMVHNNLGSVLSEKGQIQESMQHYSQALRLKPDFAEAHINLGTALSKLGRHREAMDHLQQALRINPKYPEVYNSLGIVMYDSGRFREATEYYQKAIQLNSSYFKAYYNLGNSFTALGQYQNAIEHYEKGLRLIPDSPGAHNNLASALVQVGRLQEAIEHYKQAMQIKPDDINTYKNLVLVYAAAKQSSNAIATAQKAIEIARNKGKTTEVKEIEDWLNTYRANLPK